MTVSRYLSTIGRILSMTIKTSAVTVIVGLLAPPLAVVVAATTFLTAPLPGSELPEQRPQIVAEPSVVRDANGNEIGVFRGFDKTSRIEADDVPDEMKNAIVAIEDQRFWDHSGVDVEGISRAAQANAEAGGVVQGGSTITQQYVKNVYLNGERTVERKVREAALAAEVEKKFTKEEILFNYLQSSYFGSGAYGVGAASEVYFGVSVNDLDVSQAALLAGLVQAPTRLSPRTDAEAANDRRLVVLRAMREQGYLTSHEYRTEIHRPLQAEGSVTDPNAIVIAKPEPKGALDYPHFVDWVEQELIELVGEQQAYNGGLTVETTLRPELQVAAEEAAAARLENTEYPVDMSIVTLNHDTGHVLAMVGGRQYSQSQVNLADGGSLGMQPGSSFKPVVLAKALSLGLSPETVYEAPARWYVPGCTGEKCYLGNYGGGGGGSQTLRDATRSSTNTVFTQLLVDVGIDPTVELANELGFNRLNPESTYGPSLALGAAETSPLEMASAYGTFANRGVRVEPTGIRRVIDADGNVVVDNTNRTGDSVVDQAVADTVTDVLTGVVAGGTGRAANIDRPVAGKTGTAQDYRAAWFVGYTPSYTTSVWMGHADQPASLRNINGVRAVTGGSHPARAFADVMGAAHAGTPVVQFPKPAEITPEEVETSAEVVEQLRLEKTTLNGPRSVGELPANCGSQPCAAQELSTPKVPEAQQPVRPATTTAPPVVESSTTQTTETTETTKTTKPPIQTSTSRRSSADDSE